MGTFDNLKSVVNNHYRKESAKSRAGIIGSLNIFGNPVKLLREITGEVEMVVDPDIHTNGVYVPQKQNLFQRGIKGYFRANC